VPRPSNILSSIEAVNALACGLDAAFLPDMAIDCRTDSEIAVGIYTQPAP
jgi:hypothetical protein